MKKSTHTKEPWHVAPFRAHDKRILIPEAGVEIDHDDVCHEESEANASRIVACVNALAGMEPGAVAEFVKQVEMALVEKSIHGRIVNTGGMRDALAALKGGAK